MDYQEPLKAVKDLDLVPDPQTADALVKAVLGILASSLTYRCTAGCQAAEP